ncbi:TVP38/TMEM64 family protein [Nanoarchaeota archaeon]
MKGKVTIFSITVILIFILFLFLSSYTFPGLEAFESPSYIREFILDFGELAEVAYIIWLSLAIPFPIPSTPFVLAAGYVFGAGKGFILSMIGEIIGATLAFYIIRFAGRPLLYKLAKRRNIRKFNRFFKKEGLIAALVSYAIPLFPSDLVSLFLGLTKINFPTFLFLVIVGHIPRLYIINYLGSDLYTGLTLKTLAVFLGGILFVLIIFFRENIARALSSKAEESKDLVVEKIKKAKDLSITHLKQN